MKFKTSSMLTTEQYNQLDAIHEAINKQLILLDAFMDANRPQKPAENRQEFLDELSANDASYQVAYIAEAEQEQAPELPNMEDLPTMGKPNVQETVERLDMEQTGETSQPIKFQQDLSWELVQPDDERFAKLVKWLIIDGGTLAKLEELQSTRKIRFSPSDYDHLRNLIWYREELMKGKEGAFSLLNIFSQADTTEAEKTLWGVVAKTLK